MFPQEITNPPKIDRIDEVLNDPCTSYMLKETIVKFLRRDPVDAANDADLLAELMEERVENFL